MDGFIFFLIGIERSFSLGKVENFSSRYRLFKRSIVISICFYKGCKEYNSLIESRDFIVFDFY